MIKGKIIFGIDRKEISHFTSIELHQTINDHHRFIIRVPHSVIEKPRAITMQNSQSWLGKTVHIALETQNDFLGIITDVQFEFNLDHVGSQIVLRGYSKTILLESGIKMHTWEDTTLQDMVREVIKNGADEKLQNDIQPEFKNKINYQTQYAETDFQFIQRLAKQYNEWLYYDGEKLFFGKPKNIREKERIALTFGQDLYTFKIGVKAKQTQFGAFTYNEDHNKLYKVQTEHKVEGLPRLGDQAFEASEKLFNTASLEYGRMPSGDETFLEIFLKKRQEAAVADANYITATSGNNKLKIGSIITINAQEEKELSPLDPRWKAGKPHFKTQEIGTYIITEITHKATDIGEYENSFKALPAFIKTLPEPQIAFPQAQTQQAKVIDNADPKGQGRIRVQMQWQQVKNLRSPWIRVMTPDAGSSNEVSKNRGMVFIPEIGDQVMLGFRYNDPNRPFSMGSLFNGTTGKGGGNKNYKKTVFTQSGHRIILDDTPENENIIVQDRKGNQVYIDTPKDEITIEANETINLKAKNINFIANENITATAEKNINANAKENMFLFGTKQVVMHSDKYVDIESFEDLQLTAKETNLKATELLDLTAHKMNIGAKTDLILSADEVLLNATDKIEIKAPDINEVSSTDTFPFKERVAEKNIIEELKNTK